MIVAHVQGGILETLFPNSEREYMQRPLYFNEPNTLYRAAAQDMLPFQRAQQPLTATS